MLIAVAFAPELTPWLLGGGAAVIVIVTFAYSYVVWRDDPDRASVRS
jgi:hypothetical protein